MEFLKQLLRDNPSLKSSAAGAISAAVGAIVFAPLDSVKTRMQVQKMVMKPGDEPKYKGIWDSIATIAREEGVTALYGGLGAALFALVPAQAAYYFVYQKAHLSIPKSVPMSLSHLLSATVAGTASTLVVMPLFLVKTRIQCATLMGDKSKYRGTFQSLARIYKDEGIKGLYRGIVPSLIGVSHVSVQYPAYEACKNYFQGPDKKRLGPGGLIASSAISKVIASAVTYPHEVVRARMQTSKAGLGLLAQSKKMIDEEGIGSLWTGFGTNLYRIVPMSVVSFLSYEWAASALNAFCRK